MPKPTSFIRGSVHESIFQTLCSRDAQVKRTLERMISSVPMPIDGPCLGFVCNAAHQSLLAAFSLIPDLNPIGQRLLKNMGQLDKTCKEVYEDHGVADALDTMYGRKSKYQGWTTLALLASNGVPITSGRLAAVGIELAIKLVAQDRKLVAEAHMVQLGSGHLDYDITAEELAQGMHFEGMGLTEALPWFPRTKKNFSKLLNAFSETSPPLPATPTVQERATAQWKAHAAYPNFKQRAGVLDRTTGC